MPSSPPNTTVGMKGEAPKRLLLFLKGQESIHLLLFRLWDLFFKTHVYRHTHSPPLWTLAEPISLFHLKKKKNARFTVDCRLQSRAEIVAFTTEAKINGSPVLFPQWKPLVFQERVKPSDCKLEMPSVLPAAAPARLENISEYNYLGSAEQQKVTGGGPGEFINHMFFVIRIKQTTLQGTGEACKFQHYGN